MRRFLDALTAEAPVGVGDALVRASALASLQAEPRLVAQKDLAAIKASATPDAEARLSRLSCVVATSGELDRLMRDRAAAFRPHIGGGTQARPDLFWSPIEGWVRDTAISPVSTQSIGWRTVRRDPAVREAAEAVRLAFVAGDPPSGEGLESIAPRRIAEKIG